MKDLLKIENILIVDDDASMRDIIEYYLEKFKFNITKAENGEEALKIITQKQPDLILSDLYMPKMGGLQFLELAKKSFPDIPFIMISGAGQMNDVINALRLGAWDYVVKPFTEEILNHAVTRALEQLRLINENKIQRMELEQANLQLMQSLTQLKEDEEAGKNTQQQLLPVPSMQFKNYTISHKVLPSLYLSGDFVDYFDLKDKIGFYIADVSGHGAASAFITVLLKGLVEKMLSSYQSADNDDILHPNKMLAFISDAIYRAKLGKYITMIYGVIDLNNNCLKYSIGGHYPNPIIFEGENAFFLEGKGYPLGILSNVSYQTITRKISPHFTLAMFSDGILEILKEKSLEEKENSLIKLINSSTSINHILNRLQIKNDVTSPDDITILLIKREASIISKNV